MSESLKPRFAVDLNEIERHLAQAQGASPAQPAPTGRNDPLAELARIVGQDDPFQSLLAADGSDRPRQQAPAIDDIFATRDTVTQAPRAPQLHAVRGGREEAAYDHGQYMQAAQHSQAPAQAYQHAPAQHEEDAYGNAAYAQEYYDDGQYAAPEYGQPERLDYPPLEKSRPRRGLLAVGAVVGAAVVGLGGAYMFVSGKSSLTGGAPPLIAASNEPVKVPPQNPGGVEIPNQNKQIYERSGQNGETKVVNREEQPVDVRQAVRMNGGATADATGATAGAPAKPQSSGGLNLGEPRKVRTVSIRPDGTMIQPDSAGRAAAAPAMTLPPAAQGAASAQTVPSTSGASQPAAQPKPAASTPAAVAAAPAPKPVPVAATPASASAPAPQKVASAQPVAVAPPAAAPDTTTGGYAVQLGLANSESAAGTVFAQLQRKYSDLDGMPSLIRKAEVNGNTIYRVRVGPMSKDEASSLCSKLQGQGGQCFVAKN